MADYIKREALEAELNRRLKFLVEENTEYDHYTSGYDEAVDTVENFPSAADVVEVAHGQWKYDPDAMDWNLGGFVCGLCGVRNNNLPGVEKWNPLNFAGSAYCPNCGAKMDGGEER